MKKQEKQEYLMYVEDRYDLLMNIKEERGISYGEITYIEGLNKKELKDFEEETEEELLRIYDLLKNEYGE